MVNGCRKGNTENEKSQAPFKGNVAKRKLKLICNVLIQYSCILMEEHLALLPVYQHSTLIIENRLPKSNLA